MHTDKEEEGPRVFGNTVDVVDDVDDNAGAFFII